MSYDNSLLVLAAGRGIGLDGFHKLNLVAPSTRETVLERYLRQLCADATIVVGYRAPELMARYPSLKYAYNHSWFETGSAYSAAVGMGRAPVIIIPSDLFLCEEAARTVRTATGNTIFTSQTENRPRAAVNVCTDNGQVMEIYNGPKRHGADSEFKGIVRVEDPDLVTAISSKCEASPSLAFSECLAVFKDRFSATDLGGSVTEINKVDEYIEFFQKDQNLADA